MTEVTHLERAPLTEALIDLRVVPRQGMAGEPFLGLKSRMAPAYPVVEERRPTTATFAISPVGLHEASTSSLGLQGVLFKAQDGLSIAQFRVDGFTYNRLKPYTSWGTMFPEAMRLWEIYRETARPEAMARIALRYINKMSFDIGLSGLNKYMNTTPVIMEGYPQHLKGFLTRLTLGDGDAAFTANIVQATESISEAGVTILLDIDVSKDSVRLDNELISAVLEQLHRLKNNIFFSTITDATKEMYR